MRRVAARVPDRREVGRGNHARQRHVDGHSFLRAVEDHDGVLRPQRAHEAKDARIGVDHLERAGAQDGVPAAQRNRLLEELQQIAPPHGRVVPGKSAAREGVSGAAHADLVAVVDAGRAGHRHLEKCTEAQRAFVLADRPQRARGVVAVEQVHLRLRHFPRVDVVHVVDAGGQVARIERDQCVAARFVLRAQRVGAKETERQPAEDVVHHGVEAVAAQPLARLVPDFADDVGIGVALFHRGAERLPEGDVVDLLRHVEPPAVDAKVDPETRHVEQIFAHTGIGDVELGQRRDVPPGVVVMRILGVVFVGAQRPAMHLEPVNVRRVAAAFQNVMKGPEAAAGVVEDAIQHHVHAARVCGVEQFAQRGIATQQRIDLHVVEGVIAVVGGRGKDRVQVDGVDAQRLKIIEAIHDAEQVAALKALLLRRCAPRLELETRAVDKARAARKAVGIDLVEDSVFDPVGRLKRHTVRFLFESSLCHKQVQILSRPQQSVNCRGCGALSADGCQQRPRFPSSYLAVAHSMRHRV